MLDGGVENFKMTSYRSLQRRENGTVDCNFLTFRSYTVISMYLNVKSRCLFFSLKYDFLITWISYMCKRIKMYQNNFIVAFYNVEVRE